MEKYYPENECFASEYETPKQKQARQKKDSS